MEPIVKVSNHALERYRERYGRQAMTTEVLDMFGRATPAPAWIRKQLDLVGEGPRDAHVADEAMVFITALREPFLHIATCGPLDWHVRSRRRAHHRERERQRRERWLRKTV